MLCEKTKKSNQGIEGKRKRKGKKFKPNASTGNTAQMMMSYIIGDISLNQSLIPTTKDYLLTLLK